MKLEDQIVSLELAKELKENGYLQEGLWWWCKCISEGKEKYFLESWINKANDGKMGEIPMYIDSLVTPTVAELGEVMKDNGLGTMAYSSMNKMWWVSGGKWIVEDQKMSYVIEADTEANARAKMWLYLKKEGLLKEQK